MENVLSKLTSAFNKQERRESLGVLGLAGFACLLRISLIPFGGFITTDGIYYSTLGHNLMAGDLRAGMSTYWSPLYPILIALFETVLRDAAYAGRVISALAGGLLVIPTYMLARRFTGRHTTALVTAIFVIFEPTLISFSVKVLTESLFTLLFISGILLGWVALEERKGRHFFSSGVLFGLTYLVKPEALAYVALLSLIVGIVGFTRVTGVRWIASSISLICLGTLLVAAPYLYYLKKETGRWTLSEKFSANVPDYRNPDPRKLLPDGQLTRADIVWAGKKSELQSHALRDSLLVAGAPEAARVSVSSSGAVSTLPNRPLLISLKMNVKRTLRGLYDEYGMIGELLSPVMLILMGVGFFRRPSSAERMGSQLYACAFVFSTFLGYAFSIYNPRYLSPLLPIALCWAAVGSMQCASWLNATFTRFCQIHSLRFRLGPMRARLLVISAVVLSLSFNSFFSMGHDVWDPRPVANWIRAQGLQSPLIMSTGPWPAYYAGGRHLYIPNEELPVVFAYAKQKNVDFLLLEKKSLDKTPNLATLLEGSPPPEVTKVFEYDSENNRLVVYRLNQDSPQISGTPKL